MALQYPSGLQFEVVLIGPEPGHLGIGPVFAGHGGGRGLGLFDRVLYGLQP